MSWLIVGTVPLQEFPLTQGPCQLTGGLLKVAGHALSVGRGTAALAAAATIASDWLGIQAPCALLAGDIGIGTGSRLVYKHLMDLMRRSVFQGITFHYLLPDLDWHNRILMAMEDLSSRPMLVADAGYMYVAKMSGFSRHYDLFTPDVGEMAFLADENAPHPFYTRGFLLQEEDRVVELIRRAYEHQNAARFLLVKGCRDHVAEDGVVLDIIEEPRVESMEAIGGTGDTLTGITSALLSSGYPLDRACSLAAKANRMMGFLAQPTPASKVGDLLGFLPKALELTLNEATVGDPPAFQAQGDGLEVS